MSTPTEQSLPEVEVQTQGGSSSGLAIVIYATLTMLAIRWTGFAALPYLVIFTPVLAVVAILSLTFILLVVSALVQAEDRPRI